MIIKNILYRKIEYLFIYGIGLLTAMFIALSLQITNEVKSGIENAKDRLGADLIVLPSGEYDDEIDEIIYEGKPVSLWMDRDIIGDLEEIPHIKKMVSRLYVATLSGQSCCDGQIELIGTDFENDFLLTAYLDSKELSDNEIILGSKLGIKEGETVRYFGREFTVKEVMDKTGTGFDVSGFITYHKAEEIIHDDKYKDVFQGICDNPVSMVFITSDNAMACSGMIKSQIDGVNVYAPNKKISEYTKAVSVIEKMSVIICVSLSLLSFLGIYAITYLHIRSRRKETGTMLCIGFNKGSISLLYISELLIVTIISDISALVLYLIVHKLFGTALQSGLGLPMNNQSVIPTMGIVTGVSIIISIMSVLFSLSYIYKEEPSNLIK